MNGAINVMSHESLLGWVLAGVGTVVSTLAALVAMFYRNQTEEHKQIESELKCEVRQLAARTDKCEEDRESLRVHVAKLEVRIEYLERLTKANGITTRNEAQP